MIDERAIEAAARAHDDEWFRWTRRKNKTSLSLATRNGFHLVDQMATFLALTAVGQRRLHTPMSGMAPRVHYVGFAKECQKIWLPTH